MRIDTSQSAINGVYPFTKPKEPNGNVLTVPKLADYDIHPITGFLPSDPPPLRRLPEKFEPWETVLDELSDLLLAGKLRVTVARIPEIEATSLTTHREWQRAYMVLSFIGQAYVWGRNGEATEVLPRNIAKPWYETAKYLGLRPVITYAAVELYNWKALDPSGPLDLSNLAVMKTFTGPDEAWFYLISIAIEACGAPALPAIVASLEAVVSRDLYALIDNLKILVQITEDISKVLVRMYEKNDPHIFYHRVRTYLAGWENTSELPKGLLFEGVTDPEEGDVVEIDLPKPNGVPKSPPSVTHPPRHVHGTYLKLAGASAGQSSLIHSLDVALGVEHHPTRPTMPPSPLHPDPSTHAPAKPINHIHQMRKYMPGPHREFISALERAPSLRTFVYELVNTPGNDPVQADEIGRLYNRCVENMRSFRDRHMQIVAAYIVLQAKKKKDVGQIDKRAAQASRVRESLQAQGTGGTDLIPFLKQSRNETSEARVELEV
ncbi:Indoleamine 2,3-dioxygenase [Fimicolochytrium jonesii]|uniref:Indoleamine 2,3-dioxygenase n=1 Tax=Fimicolochytrium jonesii TaxID=1396493 RepID=UPI0022FEA783|nr:Indoleamine 2,3-dioxygenase [Fimicolochytrium jonesii]KAI8824514.1 Indoleamine 2,3-dioxygenase [Fimicolochytrium jonesii]